MVKYYQELNSINYQFNDSIVMIALKTHTTKTYLSCHFINNSDISQIVLLLILLISICFA